MWSFVTLQHLHVLLHRYSAEEDLFTDFGKVLCESVALIFDLVSQLSGVAEYEDGAGLTVVLVELMQHGKNEDGRLAAA